MKFWISTEIGFFCSVLFTFFNINMKYKNSIQHVKSYLLDLQNNICEALIRILESNQNHKIILPLHSNHIVRNNIVSILSKHKRVILIEALDYIDFIAVMKRVKIILTDSGGIQEEAPTFGIPILVLRKTTERQEAIDAGVSKLVGTETKMIIKETNKLLKSKEDYNLMAKKENPYGDGKTSEKILNICIDYLKSREVISHN